MAKCGVCDIRPVLFRPVLFSFVLACKYLFTRVRPDTQHQAYKTMDCHMNLWAWLRLLGVGKRRCLMCWIRWSLEQILLNRLFLSFKVLLCHISDLRWVMLKWKMLLTLLPQTVFQCDYFTKWILPNMSMLCKQSIAISSYILLHSKSISIFFNHPSISLDSLGNSIINLTLQYYK